MTGCWHRSRRRHTLGNVHPRPPEHTLIHRMTRRWSLGVGFAVLSLFALGPMAIWAQSGDIPRTAAQLHLEGGGERNRPSSMMKAP